MANSYDVTRLPIQQQPKTTGVNWNSCTADEILRYEEDGQEVPEQYLKWAEEMAAAMNVQDDVTYEMANGEVNEEAGGGSLRIYNRDIQKLMFEALGFTDEDIAKKFGFFVNAFNYGTPPHGGLAFGLDRLTMLLTHTSSIKDVIAFPKMQNACDLMTEAPNVVDDKQLRELGLEVPKKQND